MSATKNIFQIAGKTRIYAQDGTGRDTYISMNNGGNTRKYEPSGKFGRGYMNATQGNSFGYPKQTSAQVKNVHYHHDGTGRDTYIYTDQGGFMNNMEKGGYKDRYVKGLREYGSSPQREQNLINSLSKQRTEHSPMKDFFHEGQCGIRSPKQRQQQHRMEKYQRNSVERLCKPSDSRQVDTFMEVMNKSPSNQGQQLRNVEFLRSNRDFNQTINSNGNNNALMKSGGLQIDVDNDLYKNQRATQLGDILSPGVRHGKANNLLGKDGALASLKHAQQRNDLMRDIDKFAGRRNTVGPRV